MVMLLAETFWFFVGELDNDLLLLWEMKIAKYTVEVILQRKPSDCKQRSYIKDHKKLELKKKGNEVTTKAHFLFRNQI